MEDKFLEFLVLFLVARGVAAFFLLAIIGVGYLVYYFRGHILQGLKAYGGFLSWVFGTEKTQPWRVLVYTWFIGTIGVFSLDLIDPAPGLPMTGNRFFLLMFSITAIAVYLDHRDYFRNHASKPA